MNSSKLKINTDRFEPQIAVASINFMKLQSSTSINMILIGNSLSVPINPLMWIMQLWTSQCSSFALFASQALQWVSTILARSAMSLANHSLISLKAVEGWMMISWTAWGPLSRGSQVQHLLAWSGVRHYNCVSGVDYPIFSSVPETDFSCRGTVAGEYYADVGTSCQVFHVCTPLGQGLAQRFSFLCPNGNLILNYSSLSTPRYFLGSP